MLIKKHEEPPSIAKLQALVRRLPTNHPKLSEIKSQLSNELSGIKGELSIDYYLNFLQEDYYILHGLRLPYKHLHFQIDTLLLSPHFILNIQVKNWAGTLFFDTNFHQLIRTLDDGREEILPDPLLQVERHEYQLREFLQSYLIKNIPIQSLIVISNDRSRIETHPKNETLHQKVIHSDFLVSRINQLQHEYPKACISEKELQQLSHILLKHHTPSDFPILEKYGLSSSDILKGVQCTECFHLPITRVYAGWLCPACGVKNKKSHLISLHDYAVLYGHIITNRQAREFLNLKSESLTKRILKEASTSVLGVTKGRVYKLAMEL